jgi:hypothetical protein
LIVKILAAGSGARNLLDWSLDWSIKSDGA